MLVASPSVSASVSGQGACGGQRCAGSSTATDAKALGGGARAAAASGGREGAVCCCSVMGGERQRSGLGQISYTIVPTALVPRTPPHFALARSCVCRSTRFRSFSGHPLTRLVQPSSVSFNSCFVPFCGLCSFSPRVPTSPGSSPFPHRHCTTLHQPESCFRHIHMCRT